MGLTVTFTDTSTGSPIEWLWDFGDGVTDTVQNPVHIYALSGTYDVTLYVLGQYGAIDQITKPVTVTSAINPCGVTFDFTLGSQGFLVPANSWGVYVPGQGFQSTDKTGGLAGNAFGGNGAYNVRGVIAKRTGFLPYPPDSGHPVGRGYIQIVLHALISGQPNGAVFNYTWTPTVNNPQQFTASPVVPVPPAAPIAVTFTSPAVQYLPGQSTSLAFEIDSSANIGGAFSGSVLVTSLTIVCS